MSEKLPAQISVKMTFETHSIVNALAELEGVTAGAWIRGLIDDRVALEKEHFQLKQPIFGTPKKPE